MTATLATPSTLRHSATWLLLVMSLLGFGPALAASLPDLVVTDIAIDGDCRLSVTVANQGAGTLPATAYQEPGGATIDFQKDGANFGGWGLSTIDPQRVLANPGGSVTWHRPEPKLVGTAEIRVTADAFRNVVAESNENNNSLARTFSCTPTLPDLRVSQINFTSDCRAVFQLENVGDEALPERVFRNEGVYLQRYLDGEMTGRIMLSQVDPNHAVQSPGGSVQWTDGSEYRANSTIKYRLMQLGQEWNTANNTLQVSVPQSCQVAVEQPPDLVVTDVTLDNQCRLVVTLTNAGPGPMPLSAYDPIRSPSINFYKDGAGFGGWGLTTMDPQRQLINPGSSVSWTRQTPTIESSATIRVNLDAAHELTESNENNNDFTKIVYCGGEPPAQPAPTTPPDMPDLAVTRVTYTRDCQPSVRLENRGDGRLDTSAYSAGGVYLERMIDGRAAGRIGLRSLDPRRRLQAPHSAVGWTDRFRRKASRQISYRLGGLGDDQDAGNNSGQAAVPSRCRLSTVAPPPPPVHRPLLQRLPPPQ